MFAWKALSGLENFLYRFRYVDDRLLEAIENKKIYFSDLEKLNDPNEGIKNIFWKGEKEDWKELLKHFFFIFMNIYISKNQK
jgi:hypothetical protein